MTFLQVTAAGKSAIIQVKEKYHRFSQKVNSEGIKL